MSELLLPNNAFKLECWSNLNVCLGKLNVCLIGQLECVFDWTTRMCVCLEN